MLDAEEIASGAYDHHDEGQADRIREILLMAIRMIDQRVGAPEQIDALYQERFVDIRDETRPFFPMSDEIAPVDAPVPAPASAIREMAMPDRLDIDDDTTVLRPRGFYNGVSRMLPATQRAQRPASNAYPPAPSTPPGQTDFFEEHRQFLPRFGGGDGGNASPPTPWAPFEAEECTEEDQKAPRRPSRRDDIVDEIRDFRNRYDALFDTTPGLHERRGHAYRATLTLLDDVQTTASRRSCNIDPNIFWNQVEERINALNSVDDVTDENEDDQEMDDGESNGENEGEDSVDEDIRYLIEKAEEEEGDWEAHAPGSPTMRSRKRRTNAAKSKRDETPETKNATAAPAPLTMGLRKRRASKMGSDGDGMHETKKAKMSEPEPDVRNTKPDTNDAELFDMEAEATTHHEEQVVSEADGQQVAKNRVLTLASPNLEEPQSPSNTENAQTFSLAPATVAADVAPRTQPLPQAQPFLPIRYNNQPMRNVNPIMQRFYRQTDEATLENLLNATTSPELTELIDQYWAHIEAEVPDPTGEQVQEDTARYQAQE
ncbi:hypothetical protein EK21DRAFT_112696 [Setomelanomma holmii]|uniref:Uncharacterized protein n=1 Tax=Setomelanomma holmii TaxID=210430 RepID=A0A9P4LLX4_9PLEO|nr:hypothetical protein EK21DRAFT_112696 [Setomelanomma holmii]